MIELYDNESGRRLGRIPQTQLQFLVDHLEEETTTDRDYWIDTATLEMLESDGADAELLELLRSALDGREGVEIRWEPAGD